MIELKDITFAYSDKAVLNNVNLTIEDGQYVGLIGQNGTGKSTLLKIILCLEKPQKGIVENTFRKRSFVSQVTTTTDYLFPATVFEIVALGVKWKPFGIIGKKDKERIHEALKMMGVDDQSKKSMGELSGGQQQRVRIAKALVENPDLLVLDEPTAGMDEAGKKEFMEIIEKMHEENKLTIVMVSHDRCELKDVDLIYGVRDGKIVEEKGNCPIHD